MNINLTYLLPVKAEIMASRYDIFREADRKLTTVVIDEGTVVPSIIEGSNDCCVLDSQGNIVKNSCHDPEDANPDLLQASQKDSVAKRKGRVLFAGYFDSHWGHFITDTLARLWPLFPEPRVDVDKIVFCTHAGGGQIPAGNVGKVLSLLGIDDKVEFISEPVKYDTVIVPDAGVYPREIFATDMRGVYDQIISASMSLSPSRKYGKKIYMSRSRLPKARANEAGLEEFDRWMTDNGYEVIYPERMDIVDIVHSLQGADEVAAISGTLPHNMLLGRDESNLLILEKYPTINNYQQGVDLLRRLNVTMVDVGAFIRPVDPGLGPFILYPTSCLMSYTRARGLNPPCHLNPRRIRKNLRLFFKMFRRHYNEKWVVPEWLTDEMALCCEAYQETEKTFGSWLNGTRYISLWEFLRPRIAVKRLLGRIKGH